MKLYSQALLKLIVGATEVLGTAVQSVRKAKGRDAKLASSWISSELLGLLNKAGKSITESPVSADALAALSTSSPTT